MGKCLVTKLNGVVSNNEILKIGELRVKIDSTDAPSYYNHFIATGNEVVVSKLVDDGLNAEFPNSFGTEGGYDGNLSGKGRLSIMNKYNITTLELNQLAFPEFDILEEIKYMKGLVSLQSLNQYLDAGKLAYTSVLTSLIVNHIEGKLSTLANSIPNISTLYVNQSSIRGDISELGALVKITKIDVSNTNVTGSLESFVKAQRAAGRTTCADIQFQNTQTNLTFNGSNITNNGNLSWTSNSITYNKQTITA